jgi:predicted PurR-regulated permease PerM
MLAIDSKVARSAWSRAAVYTLVVLMVCVIWVIRNTLLVFATALMLAYLLYPLVEKLERQLPSKSRIPALALPFALIIGLLTGVGFVIKGPVSNEIEKLRDQITRHENGKPTFTQQVSEWKPLGLPVGERIVKMDVFGELVAAMPGLKNTLSTGLRYVGNMFIIPILSFLVLKDANRIRDAVLEMFGNRRLVESIMMDAHVLLLEYMRALLLLCLATLIFFSIAFSVMQVRYAILLALVAFALEFVPLVGPLTATVTIIGVSEFNHYPHLLSLIAFLAVFRLFQDYVLSPQLMKRGVDLDPLLVILGVFAGGEIGGVPGIFLSVPVLALSRLIYYELRKSRPVNKRSAMVGS